MKNIIEDIFDSETMNINWKHAESNEALKKYVDVLKIVGYNSKWHLEGNVWQHTKNVVAEICNMYPYKNIDKFNSDSFFKTRKIMVLTAFFHDFGKAVTGTQNDNGDWSFHGHDIAGDKIVRELLWDEKDIIFREIICNLVKNHMNILQIYDAKNIELKLSQLIDEFSYSISHLINLKKADCKGSQMKEYDNYLEKLTKLQEMADNMLHKTIFNVVIMCGIAGSGKSTYIEKHFKNLAIISRDLIREELNMSTKGEKYVGNNEEEAKVTRLEYSRIAEMCKNKTNFVVDDMNLQKKYRTQLISFVKPYKPKITIIYVEAPSIEDNINRRNGMIKEDIIKSMIKKLDFPSESECDKLIIDKQK